MSNESKLQPLPHRTVKYITDPDQMSEAAVRGMISNPIYAGIPPYERMVSDEVWVRSASQLIEKEGAEQFLVNMLYMLRNSMVEAVSEDIIPADYDGPWPDEEISQQDDEEDFSPEDGSKLPSPWLHPMEGLIFCSHDGLPMIVIDNEFVCVSEYLYAHLADICVTDLMTQPILTLIFQNGHTLPLICPDCGQSLHAEDHNELLNRLNGLVITGIAWEYDLEQLIIEFGHLEDNSDEEDEDEYAPEETLFIHLDSARELTCPNKTLAEAEENFKNGE